MTLDTVLLDLDGVLYVGDTPIPGAIDTLHTLQQRGYRLAGVTNTSTRSRAQVHAKLERLGLPMPPERLFTPAALAIRHIGARRAALFIHPHLAEDFQGITRDDDHPEVVVMGDVGGDGYAGATLQHIFTLVMGGAELIALHKNRYWQTELGLHIDLGAFVAAIEYATGRQALTLGKPAIPFFHEVLDALGRTPQRGVMVGDDLEADVGGALQAGLQGVLVKTGKFRPEVLAASAIAPSAVLDSVTDLPGWLEGMA